MRFIRSLGAQLGAWTPPTSPRLPTTTTTFEPAPQTTCWPPAGFTWDPSSGGFWRRLKVGEQPNPAPMVNGSCGGVGVEVRDQRGVSSTDATAMYLTYLSEQNARAAGVTAEIKTGGWLTTRANRTSCTFWKGNTNVFGKRPSLAEPWANFQGFDILTPPGVINFYGVPFAVEELKVGKLSKTLIPTPEQKLLIEWAIYAKSQALVAGLIAGKGCGKNVDVAMDHTWGSYSNREPEKLVVREIDSRGYNGSINAIMAACSDDPSVYGFTTHIENFLFNPPLPTQDELSGSGGLKRYYQRGGYLLSLALINSKIKVDTATSQGGFPTGLRWGMGYALCPDPNAPWWDGQPVAMTDEDFAQGGIPISVTQGNDGDGKGWNIWIMSGRAKLGAPHDDHYTISVTPTDIGSTQKIVGAIAKAMDAVYKLICTLAPVSQPIAQQTLLKETCVDAAGKSCTKGTPGCKCTAPSTAQKDAVSVSTAVLNYACGKMAETQTPVPPPPHQLPPTPPPVLAALWTPPWWAVVLGGLGLGALVFSRSSRR